MTDTVSLPVAELTARYRSKELSPTDVVEQHLQRAEVVDKQFATFQLLTPDLAREQARASEARWRSGTPIGELDGVPVTIKDNLDVAGMPTRSGSRTTSAEPVTEDSPSVARLREAGAVFLGKTTLPEFGWKGITDSSLRGITRNPWNASHSSGGSTGGGAAALAAGVGTLVLGNDGGGSIRIPANFCGLFGIKPTFGRVPHVQSGLFCTLVSNGPIARSVTDAATMLRVLARPDDRDYYAVPAPEAGWLDGLGAGIKGMKIGYSPALQGIAPSPDVERAIASAVSLARDLGAEVEDVGPVLDPLRPIFEDHWRAGFAARLRQISRDQWDLLDPGFRELAEAGLDVSGEALDRAESARAQLAEKMAAFHRRYSLLLAATTPTPAPVADILYNGPDYDRWQTAVPYTVPFNLTGQPAAALPCGVSEAGLPIGLQIIGPRFSEALILRASMALESAIGFDTRAQI
ncbi:amidase [Bradyrhizobium sp. SYSU BS000235]|uniref:amidase n=1 Tax=Bradyrhizobium sp. SYSU BS000235 TaxID=3411332 RepID=UPI003C759D98